MKNNKETVDIFLETKVERALDDALANPHHLDIMSSLGNLDDNRIWFSRYFHEQLFSRLGDTYPYAFIRDKMIAFSGNIYTSTIIAKIYDGFFGNQPNSVELYREHFFGYVFGEVMASLDDTRLLLHNAIPVIEMPSQLMNISVIDEWLFVMILRYRSGAPLSPKGNRLGRANIDAIFANQVMPAHLRDYLNQKLDLLLPRLADATKSSIDQRHLKYHQIEGVVLQ